jgi:hypothetical protein
MELTPLAPSTYSGLLDDVVERFPISPNINEDFFSKSIVKNILFSGEIFLNDGYLINHPAARRQFLNEDSTLQIMIRNKFVRVLTRASSPEQFVETPTIMATQQSNAGFQRTQAAREWPDVLNRLKAVGPAWFQNQTVVGWPPHMMHIGFCDLIDNIFDKTHEDLGLSAAKIIPLDELRTQFYKLKPREGSSRDRFEKACRIILAGLYESNADNTRIDALPEMIELMNIANQCYHYNFALCLTDTFGRPFVADSSIGRAFEDLLDIEDVVEDEIENIPLIDIPANLPMNNPNAFANIIDPTTKVGAAKNVFLLALNDMLSVGNVLSEAERKRNLVVSADEYRRRLAEHFSEKIEFPKWEPYAKSAISIGIGQTLGGIQAIAAAADTGALAVDLLGNKGAPWVERTIVRPLRRTAFENALRPIGDIGNGDRIRVSDVRPRFASIAFNQAKAKSFASNLPRFTQ